MSEANLTEAWMKLQAMLHDPKVPSKYTTDISTVMRIVDDLQMDARRRMVFKLGADATEPNPILNGHRLGSMESFTFYEGYASTHPDFKNPYRSKSIPTVGERLGRLRKSTEADDEMVSVRRIDLDALLNLVAGPL